MLFILTQNVELYELRKVVHPGELNEEMGKMYVETEINDVNEDK